jgi:putative transposase
MPRLAPTPLQLNEEEREQLQQLVNRHSTPGTSQGKALKQ